MITKKNKTEKGSLKIVLAFFVAIVAFGILAYANGDLFLKRDNLKARIFDLKEKLSNYEKRNKELKSDIAQVGTDEYLERVAKEDLNLKKPGEEVIAIIRENSRNSTTVEASSEKSLWSQIKQFLGLEK